MILCLPFLTRKVNRVNRGDPETKASRCGPEGRHVMVKQPYHPGIFAQSDQVMTMDTNPPPDG
jgi:hypothetical protein